MIAFGGVSQRYVVIVLNFRGFASMRGDVSLKKQRFYEAMKRLKRVKKWLELKKSS